MSEQNKQLLQKAMAPKSDQLNADDLVAGSMTININRVKVNASGEQLVSIFYEGDNGKPWKPSKGMMRIMAYAYTDDPDNWVGKTVVLYRKEDVRFGKDVVGGIRISHMSHIDKPFKAVVTVSRGKREQQDIAVYSASQQSQPKQAQKVATPQREWATKIKAAVNYGSEAVNEIWAKVPEEFKLEMQGFYDGKLEESRAFDPVAEFPQVSEEPPAHNGEQSDMADF